MSNRDYGNYSKTKRRTNLDFEVEKQPFDGACIECGARGRLVDARYTGAQNDKHLCVECYYQKYAMAGYWHAGRTWKRGERCPIKITNSMRASFYGDSNDISPRQEIEDWLEQIRQRYPEHSAMCEAELDACRGDPNCYILNCKERIDLLLKNMGKGNV